MMSLLWWHHSCSSSVLISAGLWLAEWDSEVVSVCVLFHRPTVIQSNQTRKDNRHMMCQYFIHTFTHWWCRPAHLEQFVVQYLAQGHFDMQTRRIEPATHWLCLWTTAVSDLSQLNKGNNIPTDPLCSLSKFSFISFTCTRKSSEPLCQWNICRGQNVRHNLNAASWRVLGNHVTQRYEV